MSAMTPREAADNLEELQCSAARLTVHERAALRTVRDHARAVPVLGDFIIYREVDEDSETGVRWHWSAAAGADRSNSFGTCPDGLECLLTNHPFLRERLGLSGKAATDVPAAHAWMGEGDVLDRVEHIAGGYPYDSEERHALDAVLSMARAAPTAAGDLAGLADRVQRAIARHGTSVRELPERDGQGRCRTRLCDELDGVADSLRAHRCAPGPAPEIVSGAEAAEYVTPKGLREAICAAQTVLLPAHRRDLLEALIVAIDAHRPLGAGGKHGDLHTPTCGCEGRRASWSITFPAEPPAPLAVGDEVEDLFGLAHASAGTTVRAHDGQLGMVTRTAHDGPGELQHTSYNVVWSSGTQGDREGAWPAHVVEFPREVSS